MKNKVPKGTRKTRAPRAAAQPKKAKAPAATRVHDFVRGQIIAGHYPPGAMISEMEVAAALGTSRTPVREAFQVLARERWLRIFPKRGAQVVPSTLADVTDLLE